MRPLLLFLPYLLRAQSPAVRLLTADSAMFAALRPCHVSLPYVKLGGLSYFLLAAAGSHGPSVIYPLFLGFLRHAMLNNTLVLHLLLAVLINACAALNLFMYLAWLC